MVTNICLKDDIFHEKCVACIGHFDGLHLGHQKLMDETIRYAKKYACSSVLITFSQDPINILYNTVNKQLMTLEDKIYFAEKTGINEVVVLDFDKEVSELSPYDFIKRFLEPLHIVHLVCGFDFHFGYQSEGSPELLMNFFELSVIDAVEKDRRKISTSRIKEEINRKDMEEVFRLLGRPFSIKGKVIYGRQVGRIIGFRTANIQYEKDQYLLKEGVYAGKAIIDDKVYLAMINIGRNPTFYEEYPITIEAHILDFNQNIYDKFIRIEFWKYLRNEIKFDRVENLIKQLDNDVMSVKKYFNVIE